MIWDGSAIALDADLPNGIFRLKATHKVTSGRTTAIIGTGHLLSTIVLAAIAS